MYTQCPDCSTAFRVTAEVLKQAAGKVRCGGCGIAFNALDYLSESKPAVTIDPEPNAGLPELTADPFEESTREEPPQTISAEQSAALLKTLDQLAGTDIRLEDTGVEWRVLDPDEAVAAPDDDIGDEISAADIEALEIDDDASDEFEIDLDAVIADAHDDIALDPPEITGTSGSIESELRFDDNTGIPEDFDGDSAGVAAPAVESQPVAEAPAAPEDTQVDLAFGEPDEWGELLDEVADPDTAQALPAETDSDLGDALVEPETSVDAVDDSSPSIADELAALVNNVDVDDVTLVDVGAGEATNDADLIELEADDLEADALEVIELVSDESSANDASGSYAAPLDIDTQFGMQAAAMGIEISSVQELNEGGHIDVEECDVVDEEEPAIPDSTGALEFELARAQEAVEALDTGEHAQLDEAGDDASDDDDTSIDEDLISAAFENEQTLQDAEPEAEPEVDPGEEPTVVHVLDAHDDEPDEQDASDESFDFAEFAALEEQEELIEEADKSSWHFVPEPTEQENTINRMIDQDLLRLAIEDDDGVASTMVLEGKKVGNSGSFQDQLNAAATEEPPLPRESTGVETIIMEGEFVRTALEEEALADVQEELEDAGFLAAAKQSVQRSTETDGVNRFANPRNIVAAVVVLGLFLVGQVVHQSRAALATVPSLSGPLETIYDAVGAPITPQWDVTGWRFEVTKGSTRASDDSIGDADVAQSGVDANGAEDESTVSEAEQEPVTPTEEVLTIFSRIANQSDRPLPYPLLSVSLTDRFEETIGSKVLQPEDYLGASTDPALQVSPGNTFNAVISITAPAPDATGFKLNVCYRNQSGSLRCALDDFK